jgi:hypothetical protein
MEAIRPSFFSFDFGISFAFKNETQGLLPHEMVEWLGRPVHESIITQILTPYRELLLCQEWYSNAAAHAFKEYSKYAMKYHPRGDVVDEVLFAMGKLFVWQAEELRFFDPDTQKEPRYYEIDRFIV